MGHGLQKSLGTKEVFAICAGAMISSGLFILPGIAYAGAGPSMTLAYVLAGLLCIPALFSKAELATAMPKSGGIYFYIDRSMGPTMGTLGGLAGWFSLSLKSAFALVGMGAFVALLFPSLGETQLRFVAAGLCVVFTAVNLLGAHHAGKSQVYMVFVLLAILVVYGIAGIASVESHRFTPFFEFGSSGLVATIALVFVSFGGLTKAASVAEEVRDPGVNLPRGMFLAFGFVVMVYALVTSVTVGLVEGGDLATTLLPLNLGAEAAMGSAGVIVISIAAVLAFVSTANAGILAASRVPLAMSRDGLLPPALEVVSEKRGVPAAAIIVTGGFMVAVTLLLDLEGLVKMASTLKLLLFLLVNVAVILMRESHIHTYRPAFRSPWYPWVQIFGIISYLVLIAAMGTLPIALTALFVLGSLAWYHYYGKRQASMRIPAWFYVVKRIAGKDLDNHTLGGELRDIVRERDGMQDDRFDRLVRNCEVLQLDGPTSLLDFAKAAADELAQHVGMSADALAELILARELDTHSDIGPTLAVPHAAVPEPGHFHLLVARCPEGIHFSDEAPAVHAAFVVVVSEDEREFHLRALAAITEIAQQPGFERRWMGSRSTEDLRDLLLVGTRQRGMVRTSATADPAPRQDETANVAEVPVGGG